MPTNTPIRVDVVKQLANLALQAMNDAPIVDLQVNEVVSAVFTLALHVTDTVLAQCESVDLEHNREVIDAAIIAISKLVHPQVM